MKNGTKNIKNLFLSKIIIELINGFEESDEQKKIIKEIQDANRQIIEKNIANLNEILTNVNKDYFTRNINSPFIHLWYISILLQFDLVFPLIFTLLKRVENKVKNNISTIIVAFFTIFTSILFYYMSNTQDFMMAYYNSFARSFSILFGILLALVHYKYNIKFSRIFKEYNIVIFIAA